MVSHDKDLQEYICEKASWTFETFDKVEWKGIESYMGSIPNTIQTNVINMTHNWIHYGYQKDVFTTEGDAYLCLVECGRMEAHQHYINAIHHLWFTKIEMYEGYQQGLAEDKNSYSNLSSTHMCHE